MRRALAAWSRPRALAAASGAHRRSSRCLPRLTWISWASGQAVIRSVMHDSRTVFPLPFLAKTPDDLAALVARPTGSAAAGRRSPGRPPITRGLRMLAGSSMNRANGEPGSTGGMGAGRLAHGSLRRTRIQSRPGMPVGGDVDPAGRDHLDFAEPLGHVPAADLAGPAAGAAGVDQHLIAEQRVVVRSAGGSRSGRAAARAGATPSCGPSRRRPRGRLIAALAGRRGPPRACAATSTPRRRRPGTGRSAGDPGRPAAPARPRR